MKNKIIYTNVEWFSATDDPNKNLIPSEIIEAKNVWNANGGKSTSETVSYTHLTLPTN